MDKSPDAFRTISEVADYLETPAHVLRFWESRFPQIKPVKRAGGRRYYRPADVALLCGIKRLLHDDGMTIRGVQKILREQGVRHVAALGNGDVVMDEVLLAATEVLDGDFVAEEPAEPVSAEIVPFAPPVRAPEIVLEAVFEANAAPHDPDPVEVPDAPFVDTDAEPDWRDRDSDEEIIRGVVIAAQFDQAEPLSDTSDLAETVAEKPPELMPAPIESPPSLPVPPAPDLWAAAGVVPPEAVAPPLSARRAAAARIAATEDELIEVDLRDPPPLAARLRALSAAQLVEHAEQIAVLRDRLASLRAQIATAAHVRPR